MNTVKINIKPLKSAAYQEDMFFLSGFIIIEGVLVASSKKLVKLLNRKKINKVDLLNSDLNGEFLLIIQGKNKCTIVTDLVRTKPAFIVETDEDFMITDDLRTVPNKEIDEEQVSRFIGANCLFGSHNCFKNVYTCQAGEMVTIANGEIQSERYFEFVPEPDHKKMEVDQFVSSFNSIMEKIFEQMVASAPEVNNWLIPLSGGLDSRIIVSSLKKAGIENVICFSYGIPANTQTIISKQVADAAEYEWHFVEYTEDKWDKLHENGMIDEYFDYSFQGVSQPHVQDFLALYELKRKNIINNKDIFLPGHTPVTGSGYTNETESFHSMEQALEHVQKKYMNSIYKSKEELYAYLGTVLDLARIDKKHVCAYINWQERKAKYINNSVRVYEFFGCDFRLPFWDRSLVEFWLTVDTENRLNRNLYKRSIREGILLDRVADIPFGFEVNNKSGHTQISQQLRAGIPHFIKACIPHFIKEFIFKNFGRKPELAEGLYLIFAKRGNKVKEIIGPIDNFPKNTHALIKPHLNRYTYQIKPNLLLSLYTANRALDGNH